MATFGKYNPFVENLAEKVFNLGSDTLKVALTNTAPDTTDGALADIAEIAGGNGYTAGGNAATQSSSAQTGGTYKLVCADVVFTATGNMAQFRYAVLYDDTATNNELIGYWDYGSAIDLINGETFTVDLSPTNGVLQLS